MELPGKYLPYNHFSFYNNAPINVIPGGEGGGVGGGDFDKAFMPEGVAFDFMDSTQGADI